MVQGLSQRGDRWPPPFDLPLQRTAAGSDRHLNVMPDEPVKQRVDAAEFLELLEQQFHHRAGLRIRIKVHFARW